ncbi:McrC family protein [Burkholderia pseudomallei]|uniref:McrC family protein n=1 Tax=Burkholderia pseudomallei TaxID=28450 RepID=UPI001F3C4C40|nr:McrC family protein [Burkholderia pseudomallei]
MLHRPAPPLKSMEGLRTITALEHEIIPVGDADSQTVAAGSPRDVLDLAPHLTETEAQALLRLNDLRPGFCQRVSGGIKVAQYCGIVRLQTCVLEVLPKIGAAELREVGELEWSRAALLTMLHRASDIVITNVGNVPQQAVRAPLLDIFIEAFLHCALEQARRGLLSRYVTQVEDLPTVKGRFHAHGHVRRNLGRPHLLHCEYDEFTADNAYNRAVRATLEVCRGWIARESTQRLWSETQARFASVSSVRMSAADVHQLPRGRMTRRYESTLTWCEWLLSMTSPAMSAGTAHAPGLLFDMNKLFEAYVSSLEEAAAGDERIVHRQGPVQALAIHGESEAFTLKPDITVWHTAPDGTATEIDRILDAKWKRLDRRARHWGVEQADVYQLVAYGLRYCCRQLELVYPHQDELGFGTMPTFEIANQGLMNGDFRIVVRTVPLWCGD